MDYYGSGDVNNDESVDSTNLTQILNNANYRSDIDGYGISGAASDKINLKNYITGKIDHLPCEWNNPSGEEKIYCLDKMKYKVNLSLSAEVSDYIATISGYNLQ